MEILSTMLSFLGAYPVEVGKATLKKMIFEARAFKSVSESLREKYDPLFSPADYTSIVSNVFIDKKELIDAVYGHSGDGDIKQRVIELTRGKMSTWTYNRPDENTVNAFILDFVAGIFAYYIKNDSQLLMLAIYETNSDIHDAIRQIKSDLFPKIAPALTSINDKDLPHKVKTYAVTCLLPISRIIENSYYIAIVVDDTSSFFPSRVAIVSFYNKIELVRISDLNESSLCISQVFVVADGASAIHTEHVNSAVKIISLKDLEKLCVRISSSERYIYGSIATREFQDHLGISNIYITPRATVVNAKNSLTFSVFKDYEYFRNVFEGDNKSAPAEGDKVGLNPFEYVDNFVSSQVSKLLFIFGDYGCGKTSFGLKLVERYSGDSAIASCLMIQLKNLQPGADLGHFLQKADSSLSVLNKEFCRPRLIILDGLDELPDAIDLSSRRNNLLKLVEYSARVDHVIVTGRASYFCGIGDLWHLFGNYNANPYSGYLSRQAIGSEVLPSVSAIYLGDFNTDQVDEYITAISRTKENPKSFADSFRQGLLKYDPNGIVMSVIRSPLFLQLFTERVPWDDSKIPSIAYLIRYLIDFWLDRDIAKGLSRWGLSKIDRNLLLYSLAWYMHSNGKFAIGYNELHSFVSEFYSNLNGGHDRDLINKATLDIQTTGIFSTNGEFIYFASPAFFDYYVAIRYIEGDYDSEHEFVIPTLHQSKIILAITQTCNDIKVGRTDEHYVNMILKALKNKSKKGCPDINVSPDGIVFDVDKAKPFNWNVNQDESLWLLKLLVDASLKQSTPSLGLGVVRLLVTTRHGIHARPAAIMCRAYNLTRQINGKFSVIASYGGSEADPSSILELMFLAAGCGSIIQLTYSPTDKYLIETFMKYLRAKKSDGYIEHDWYCAFEEGNIAMYFEA